MSYKKLLKPNKDWSKWEQLEKEIEKDIIEREKNEKYKRNLNTIYNNCDEIKDLEELEDIIIPNLKIYYKEDRLNIFKYIININWIPSYVPKKPTPVDFDIIFGLICRYGYLDLVKYMIIKYPETDISWNDELATVNACYSGNLELVKYLFNIKPNIDISARYYEMYNISVLCGHLDIIKFLVEQKNLIKYSNLSRLFKNACNSNNLEVVKFIYQLCPNIQNILSKEDIFWCFTYANKKKNIDLVEYLHELFR